MASATFDASNSTHLAEITSDNTQVDNANDNLLYDLSLLDSTWWNNQEDASGADIRITDDTGTKFGSETAYSFELENFTNNGDGTGTGIIFFDSSHLATGSDTTWRIYCGDTNLSLPADSDTLGAHNVWNSNENAVWHHEDTGDSTGNGNTLSANGGVTAGDTSGIVGKATKFDGTDDYFSHSSVTFGEPGALSFWLWRDTSGDYMPLGSIDDNGNFLRLKDDQIKIQESDGSTTVTFSETETTGQWDYLFFSQDSTNGPRLWKNGAQLTKTDEESGWGFGCTFDTQGEGHSNETFWLDGNLDEVRYYGNNIPSSAGNLDGWQQTEYNNQNDPASFWTTAATESGGGGGSGPPTGTLSTLGVGV